MAIMITAERADKMTNDLEKLSLNELVGRVVHEEIARAFREESNERCSYAAFSKADSIIRAEHEAGLRELYAELDRRDKLYSGRKFME